MQNNDVLLENPIGMTGAISFSFSTPCCLFTFWGILVDLYLHLETLLFLFIFEKSTDPSYQHFSVTKIMSNDSLNTAEAYFNSRRYFENR